MSSILGTVTPGSLPCEEELTDTMSLDEFLIPTKSDLHPKVNGESMIEPGSCQGYAPG